MEVSLERITKQVDEAFDIGSFQPVESSASVTKDYMRSFSKLPMMRNRVELHQLVDENQRYRQQDEIMQEYLQPVLLEIAEIRNTIKDIAPFLRSSQKYLQAKIFAYARNHTAFSKRVRSLRARVETLAENNDNDSTVTSRISRYWHRFIHSLLSALTPNFTRRQKERQNIEEAFKNFYEINGASFRLHLMQGMARCRKLETMLSNLRLQMTNFNLHRTDDSIAGVAAHVGVSRQEMYRWRQDVEYVWREAKNIRGVFGLLPVHNCWKAIYNIMIGNDKFNLYV